MWTFWAENPIDYPVALAGTNIMFIKKRNNCRRRMGASDAY